MKRFISNLFYSILLAIGIVGAVAFPAAAVPLLHLAAETTEPIVIFTLPLPLIVGLVTGTLLPLAVALVTNANWSPRAKGLLLAALAALTGLFTSFGDFLARGETFDLGIGLLAAVVAFVGAVVSYFGIYSRPGPDGVSIAKKTSSLTDH